MVFLSSSSASWVLAGVLSLGCRRGFRYCLWVCHQRCGGWRWAGPASVHCKWPVLLFDVSCEYIKKALCLFRMRGQSEWLCIHRGYPNVYNWLWNHVSRGIEYQVTCVLGVTDETGIRVFNTLQRICEQLAPAWQMPFMLCFPNVIHDHCFVIHTLWCK